MSNDGEPDRDVEEECTMSKVGEPDGDVKGRMYE